MGEVKRVRRAPPASHAPIPHQQRVLDIGEVHHDVLRRSAGQPPEFFRRAHVGFEVGDERRHEHEIAFRQIEIVLEVLAEINAGAAGQPIGAGFGLA